EVPARGGLDSVEAVPQIDLVQVQLEDAILRELVFDLARQHELPQLPPDRARGSDLLREHIAGELHGDGARPFARAEGAQVAPERAQHAAKIDPAVLVEAAVLDGEERAGDSSGNPGDR